MCMFVFLKQLEAYFFINRGVKLGKLSCAWLPNIQFLYEVL